MYEKAARSYEESTERLLEGLEDPLPRSRHSRLHGVLRRRRLVFALSLSVILVLVICFLKGVASRQEASRPPLILRPLVVNEAALPGAAELAIRLHSNLSALQPANAPTTAWPKIIWQTWKDESMEDLRQTWSSLNPEWQYNLLLDAEAERLVKEEFATTVPDVWQVWVNLQMPVLRADLLRYLLLYRYGGVYADVDVEAVRPISTWISDELWLSPEAHTLTGVELDDPFATEAKLRNRHWTMPYGFVQYAMMTKPYSPVAREAIVNCVLRAHYLVKEEGLSDLSELTWSRYQVLYATGPASWTQAVLAVMLPETPPAQTWLKGVHALHEPKLSENVVLLPVNAFAAGQMHSGSHPIMNNQEICLLHQNLGSWKKSAKVIWETSSWPSLAQVLSAIDDTAQWFAEYIFGSP